MMKSMYDIDNDVLGIQFNSILEKNIVIDDPLRLLKVILISWNMFSSQSFKFL
jgi:hypothetical protein